MALSEIPHMTYQQYRTARRLVHECCNYDCRNRLLLDNGKEAHAIYMTTTTELPPYFFFP